MNTTIEQLAEKLNKTVWVKGDLKRIYMDSGYNTKKMKTTTYIEVRNGEFAVRCFIDCHSQSQNWIESQQNEVIESIEKEIQEALATEYFYITNENGKVVDENGDETELVDLYLFSGLYLNELNAKHHSKRQEIEGEIKSISREDFEKLEQKKPVNVFEKVQPKQRIPLEKPVANKEILKLEIGTKVNVARFGVGYVIELDEEKVKIRLYPSKEEKQFLRKFVKLEIVNG